MVICYIIQFFVNSITIIADTYGVRKQFEKFYVDREENSDCMLGLPDITVISIGSVFVIIIILLVYWGLWYNPK